LQINESLLQTTCITDLYIFYTTFGNYNRSMGTFLCLIMNIFIFYPHIIPRWDYLTIFSWGQPIDLIKTKELWICIGLSQNSIY